MTSLVKLFAAPDEAMGEVIRALAKRIADEGLSWEVVCQVRSYSRSIGKEMTVDEILDKLQTYIDTFGGNVDVRKAFEERLAKDRESMSARSGTESSMRLPKVSGLPFSQSTRYLSKMSVIAEKPSMESEPS